NDKFKGYNFSELSGLAFNKKRKQLYMVSDKGRLFSYGVEFTTKGIKLNPQNACNLERKNGKRLKKYKRDSEGVALDNNGKLYIGFEGKPKIASFTYDCKKIKNLPLPKALKRAKLRSSNKSLEALAFHPKYGFITALEYPKKGDKKTDQTIYSTSGKEWHLKIDSIKKNAIVAIEVMDDGNLLILERAHIGLLNYVITLRKLYINQCPNNLCKSKKLIQMESKKGWDLADFEGLANLGGGRYLMISDNSDLFFLKNRVVFFQLNQD
ncbi:MAG TPA: esterase-like activity of phytase family protein, partial [Nitratifractor sp.]|nr:esterase-like activity of phytase family protein [Nitratifractor sp.]